MKVLVAFAGCKDCGGWKVKYFPNMGVEDVPELIEKGDTGENKPDRQMCMDGNTSFSDTMNAIIDDVGRQYNKFYIDIHFFAGAVTARSNSDVYAN